MRQTTNYGLKMPEVGDVLSIVPLNENAQAIDTALYTIASGQVMMACGSYAGNDTTSVTIETPGFIPRVVLMRTKGDWCDGGVYYYQSLAVQNGWCLWMGEESMALSQTPDKSTCTDTIIFTAQEGSLSWSMDSTDRYAGRAMNNDSEHTYQWVALGVAKE